MQPAPNGYADYQVILSNDMLLPLRIDEATRELLANDWDLQTSGVYQALNAENAPIVLFLCFTDVLAITRGGFVRRVSSERRLP